jgi:tetratricopeptide (TPR) repeat protein
MNSEWRGLLERINANVSDLSLFVPRDKQMDYARGAALAYLHAKRGNYGESLALIASVLEAIPDARYLPWLARWLATPEIVDRLPPEILGRVLARLVTKFPGDFVDDAQMRQALEQLIPAVERCRAQYPDDPTMFVLSSGLVRKVGRYEQALELAKKAYTMAPTGFSATMVAIAHRALGDIDEAVTMYRKSLEFQPDDISVRLDLGDMLTGEGHIQEGLGYYKQVLDLEKNHPWAKPHYLYFKAQLEPEENWDAQFKKYMDTHSQDAAIQSLFRHATPYLGYLPGPTDATINTLRQHGDKMRKDVQNTPSTTPRKEDRISMTLSSLESPSSRLALDLFLMEAVGVKASVSIMSIPTPDPRLPLGDVDFVLWRYNANDPEPSIELPSEAIAQKVARVAAQAANLDRLFRSAHQLGATLSAEHLNDLLGIMVHPPSRPHDVEIWNWIHHLQVASALTIANLNATEAWITSQRRRALFSLARGPMDWSVEAALIALRQVARETPQVVPDLARLWMELIDHLPTSGGIPHLEALVYCGLSLPGLPESLQTRLDTMRKRL